MTKNNAVCPKCRTYTSQDVVRRGERRCECGFQFLLRDSTRIVSGKVVYGRVSQIGEVAGSFIDVEGESKWRHAKT